MTISEEPSREQLDPAVLFDAMGSTVPVERADDALTRWAPNENVPPLPKRTAMPKIVHSVWLGGPLRNAGEMANFRDNIAAAVQNHPDYTFALWTDVPRSLVIEVLNTEQPPVGTPDPLADVRDMLVWAWQNRVKLISVDEVFNAESPMQLQEFYQVERIKQVGRGYAAASDILRMEILHRFGGVYTDPDNEVNRLEGIPSIIASPEGYAVNKDKHNLVSNSALVMPEGHPFAQLYLNRIRENYGKTQMELLGDMANAEEWLWDSQWGKIHRNTVMRRTGPEIFRNLARDIGYPSYKYLPGFSGIPDYSAASWLKDIPAGASLSPGRDRAATLLHVKMVVQALVRELFNGDGNLNLALVEEAVDKHSQRDLIWTAAVTFIASQPDLAGLVTHATDRRVFRGEEQVVRWPDSARALLNITEGGRQFKFGEYRYPATMSPPATAERADQSTLHVDAADTPRPRGDGGARDTGVDPFEMAWPLGHAVTLEGARVERPLPADAARRPVEAEAKGKQREQRWYTFRRSHQVRPSGFQYEVRRDGWINMPDESFLPPDGWVRYGDDFVHVSEGVYLRGDSGWIGRVDNIDTLRDLLNDPSVRGQLEARGVPPVQYTMRADESGLYLTSTDGNQSFHLPLTDTQTDWVKSSYSVPGPDGLERCVEVTVIALG
jgi:mannosyltransferase OCH1-like enzyme